jgi:subtilisin family serine protease
VDEKGEDDLQSLQEMGAIHKMEPEVGIRLESLPNDPMVESQGWVLGEEGIDIGVTAAWDTVTGSPQVTVAVIDTGIDLNHPDLKDNLWNNGGEIAENGSDDDQNGFVDDIHGFNFWDRNGDVKDENNHGSHLAGIVGAIGNNGIGIAGINWDVRLMSLKFTDAQGNGSSAGAVEAIDYAIQNGADVINASWTLKLEGQAPEEDSLLKKAIQKAGEAGILFVTAAGNQFATGEGLNIDESPVYPARFALDTLVAVAALDSNGELASYSNYGPQSVDLAAPGAGILSTLKEGDYGAMTGTSIATAFVSGAAALLFSLNPDLSPQQVKSALEVSATQESSLGGHVSSGGSLSLVNSIAVVQSGAIPSVSETENPIASQNVVSSGGCSLIVEGDPALPRSPIGI